MRLMVISVGERMPQWQAEGFAEYQRRFSRQHGLEIVEIKAEKRGGSRTVPQILEAEGARMRAAIPRGARVVGLDASGKALSTEDLAERWRCWESTGETVALLIGGADGLFPELRRSCSEIISLSRMTFPHGLVRVILAEQLYRAWACVTGHPYHRGDVYE